MPLIEMDLQYQPYIEGPPMTKEQLWQKCTGADKITTDSWGTTWTNQSKANAQHYNYNDLSAIRFAGQEGLKPVIVAGSGPSMKKNLQWLSPRTEKNQLGEEMQISGRGDIKIVSCLHNFPFFEDNGVMTKDDFYITLDAGPITIREVIEGGKESEDWYWDRTKDRTLIAHHSTHPDLLKRWQGDVYFFTDQAQTPKSLEQYGIDPKICIPFSVGGCVAGGALYFAEAILGASNLVFIGMDFSFDYMKKFHAWSSQYDNMFKGVIPCTDVFGNRVWTWPSYFQFKCFFEHSAVGGNGGHPHNWINCTEGGILGAWADGNIKQIKQMDLKNCLRMFNRHTELDYWAKKLVLMF